jgi:nucleoside-diphosphate-sugar epimerase
MAPLVAVLGASRFLGRLAIPMFAAEGWRVRALDRRQAAIAGMLGVERDWADPLDERSLTRATTDCTCVLDLGSSEVGADAVATTEAALLAGGAGRIIRLERLGSPVLPAPGGDPARVTIVRCAPVIGAGAPWIVILRALGDRLPVIPCPAWMRRGTEPVAAADAVQALVWLAGAETPDPAGYDLAGEDRTTYRELLALVANAHGRRPRLVDAGIAGDVVTRVAVGVAARSEPEVATLAAALPAPESVAGGSSLLRRAELPITPLADAIRAAAAGGRRRGI